VTSEVSADNWKSYKKMSSTKADRKAAGDAASWLFNVVTSVGIILVNKALMATYGYSFGMLLMTIYSNKSYQCLIFA